MKDANQIAAEAAEQCSAHAYDVYRISGKDTSAEFKRIIKSACEKAYQAGVDHMAEWDKDNSPSAAHASETCRYGHPILEDNYCKEGHPRPV